MLYFVFPTCQKIIGPPSQLTGLTGELILNVLVVLTRGADPTAAHLALPDHLHTQDTDLTG